MSDVSNNSLDGELSEQPAGLPVHVQSDQRWTGSKPVKATWTVLAAFFVALFAALAITSGSLVAAVIAPIAVIALAVAGCYRLWRSSVELTGDGTLIVANLLRTYHIPVVQIFSMRRSEYGIRITLIDGRLVTAGVLQTGRRRQPRGPDQADNAIAAITQAVEAARVAQPAETSAAIDAGAPLRAKRTIRRVVVMTVVGPAILLASYFASAAGINLDGRLWILGIACMPMSLIGAYSLVRLARPGGARVFRRPRRR